MRKDDRIASRAPTFPGVGAIVIGRNEGERLRRCLHSIAAHKLPIVYVDSGSTDGSVEFAASLGAEVVFLSSDTPFTAARARNAGFARLKEVRADLIFVQFVDGDCELADGWLETATEFLENHRNVALVCGRRKERYPEQSVYNALCDMEWDTAIGEADSSGGDFLARVAAFESVGGFNDSLIAGEEPEMCYRIRLEGWKIFRLDSPMTRHDAAMRTFSQWARRSARAGYAYAAGAFLHWRDLRGHLWRENGRIMFWGLVLPLAVLALTLTASPWFALLLLAYPIQYFRVFHYKRARYPVDAACTYALFTMIGKWTELYGQLMFFGRIISHKEQRLIEYK